MADNVFTRHDTKIGTGISDDFYFEHDGANSNITNNTGNMVINSIGGNTIILTPTATKKTIIDNGINNRQFVIDHDNNYIGIGTSSPSYHVTVNGNGTTAQVNVEYNSGTETKLVATSALGQVGTRTTNPFNIVSANTSRVTISSAGDVSIPNAYSTIIGGTNVDLFIDSSGLLGPNPSMTSIKKNIRNLLENETDWVYQIPVKKCDYTDGTTDIITVISEDAEMVNPKIIRYGMFEILPEGPKLLKLSDYDYSTAMAEMLLNAAMERNDLPVYRKNLDDNENPILIEETKTLRLLPITVNKSDLIYPLLHQIQLLKTRIEALEAT